MGIDAAERGNTKYGVGLKKTEDSCTSRVCCFYLGVESRVSVGRVFLF